MAKRFRTGTWIAVSVMLAFAGRSAAADLVLLDTHQYNANGYTLTVPANAVSMAVEVSGGGGGGAGSDLQGPGGNGGSAAHVQATISLRGQCQSVNS
ncbi:hypothetical protein [Paracidovorax anthurii]|uniref:Uncharacterized protein n=1 Tax=Paracidovorax anthurii TaxID=78229 RepID=A0A328ZK15_9BURK|nr:hypothetical protein [Paracidovorax anthurii]RAR83157.1 hypothetical protein AX018_10152 [Paracidovorax anthurii]